MLIWLILENRYIAILPCYYQSRSDVACSLTLDEVPGDSDLFAYLSIEMAIVLLQWVSFAAMPRRTLNPLSVVTVGCMSGGSCHSVVEV